jgi:hypothetical protein
MAAHPPGRVAILWELAWNDGSMLACSVYRDRQGFEMRVESNGEFVSGERCELRPRTIARAQALHDALVRRGWRDSP